MLDEDFQHLNIHIEDFAVENVSNWNISMLKCCDLVSFSPHRLYHIGVLKYHKNAVIFIAHQTHSMWMKVICQKYIDNSEV